MADVLRGLLERLRRLAFTEHTVDFASWVALNDRAVALCEQICASLRDAGLSDADIDRLVRHAQPDSPMVAQTLRALDSWTSPNDDSCALVRLTWHTMENNVFRWFDEHCHHATAS